MEKYQALVTKIYDAVVASARWGCDADEALLDRLEEIVRTERPIPRPDKEKR